MRFIHHKVPAIAAALCFSLLAACDAPSSASGPSAVAEVSARSIAFPQYPQAGNTYLSYSGAHGFQVNYIGSGGKAWLWYPGNSVSLPEEYKLDEVRGIKALCWRHPGNSYNPVTKKSGGQFACQSLELSRKTIIAKRNGDLFGLSSGRIPYRLNRCKAPSEFTFDRRKFGC